MKKIRILIVDDHEVVRLGLRALIESDPDMVVVAETGKADKVLESVERNEPDILLLDIKLPGRSGLEVCREIHHRFPDTKVIILTSYIQADLVSEAIRAGACGYVVKEVGSDKLLESIRTVNSGETALDSKSATHLITRFREIDSQLENAAFKDLSPREMDVLAILAKGRSNREIGVELQLREVTVRNYVSSIFSKLGLSNRIELALYAEQHKISRYRTE